jgi:hypothetical protein
MYKMSMQEVRWKAVFPVVPKPKVRPFWGSRMSHGVKVLAPAAFHRLRQNAANACRVATRREQLELVAGLAAAFDECEDLPGFDGEHEVRICENSLFVFIVEVKIPVAYLVWPASIPLGRPHRG